MAAKAASAACDGQAEQNRIIGSATQCAVNASQLVTCTKIVAPTLMTSTECQEQLVDAAKEVAGYVDNVVQITEVRRDHVTYLVFPIQRLLCCVSAFFTLARSFVSHTYDVME
jgi:DNA-binding ferritin-like protein